MSGMKRTASKLMQKKKRRGSGEKGEIEKKATTTPRSGQKQCDLEASPYERILSYTLEDDTCKVAPRNATSHDDEHSFDQRKHGYRRGTCI